MSIADQWRERLTGWYYTKVALPAELNNSSLNQLVMQLPTGVYAMQQLAIAVQKNPPKDGSGGEEVNHASSSGEANLKNNAAEFKIMPLEVSLQDYIQEAFFNTIKEPHNIPILTLPVYLTKERLEKLEGWADWLTLKGYLAQSGLMPFVVFKNVPKNIPNVGTCYLCDIRVGWIE